MDNADRYPFGFIFNKQNPTTGRPVGSDSSYITWFSLIDQYLSYGAAPNVFLDANSGFIDGATTRKFYAAFKCPSVTSNYQQMVQYYQNAVVMPHMPREVPAQFRAPGFPIINPAKANQLYSNTALIWDTPVYSGAASVTPWMFWLGNSDTISGLTAPLTKIDGAQLFHPEWPELRYRGPSADRFASSVNPLRNPAGPIYFPSDQYLQQLGAVLPSYNADAVGQFITFMVGGPRYRHTGLGCNVLFADGSVRTLYLRPYRKIADGIPGTGGANYIDSDFRRNMLMIKWPPGITDTNTIGTNSTR
jgi:prepilin-type processing-associated H-X9-DG protein